MNHLTLFLGLILGLLVVCGMLLVQPLAARGDEAALGRPGALDECAVTCIIDLFVSRDRADPFGRTCMR